MKHLPDRFIDIKPTILEVENANELVTEVLGLAESGEYDPVQIAETLVELLGRLSDRYTSFNPDSAQRSFEWAKASFDLNNIQLIDALLTILMNGPSLQAASDFVSSKIASSPSQETTDLLQEFCREADEGL